MSFKTTYLSDYTPYPYRLVSCELYVEIHDSHTEVRSKISVEPIEGAQQMRLNGLDLKRQSLQINGHDISPLEENVDSITIETPTEPFTLETVVHIHPDKNSSLEGLYQSGSMYCTQNEAEGFRRITYFPDRPDVMSLFTTTIVAKKDKYPVLLSNGNCVGREDLTSGRHSVTWHDPFLKPCYLYALVAGDLAVVKDHFITRSNRRIELEIYVDHGNENKTEHAFRSLKKSMAWDEEVYDREYDLELFMIVAVDAFNMGAMENKGLNIFNSSCVLANDDIATDDSFYRIESIIAHEYFHNWTGNRITCRDWFQLTLKEGLTVFRDQEFSGDMHSRAVQRLQDVALLRRHQFPEDDGPLSHPIKPDHYKEINNFYTSTIYDKGAEIIRMFYTLLGKEAFFEGMATYFKTFDGQAVRTEDFAWAMQSATDRDLTPFLMWYQQAGRPRVSISRQYDESREKWILSLEQSCPTHPDNKPFYIPIKISRLSTNGQTLADSEDVLILDTASAMFELDGSKEELWTLFNDFSAPVSFTIDYSLDEQERLIQSFANGFSRYEQIQALLKAWVLAVYDKKSDLANTLKASVGRSFTWLLENDPDDAFLSYCLRLPDLQECLDLRVPYNVEGMFQARESVGRAVFDELEPLLRRVYTRCCDTLTGKTGFNTQDMASRQLLYYLLFYLSFADDHAEPLLLERLNNAQTMTDTMESLGMLQRWNLGSAPNSLAHFYDRYHQHFTVLTRWFSLQVSSPYQDPLSSIEALMQHKDFELTNPNKCRAVLGGFSANLRHFHAADGRGYRFMAESLAKLDPHNGIMAARLATCFESYPKCSPEAQAHIRAALQPILDHPKTSRNLSEIIEKIITT